MYRFDDAQELAFQTTQSNETIRLYRGQPAKTAYKEIPSWIRESASFICMVRASGRWFTDSLDEAKWYLSEHTDGEIVFVDLTPSEVEQFRVSNMDLKPGGKDAEDNPRAFSKRPEVEFYLPEHLVDLAEKLDADEYEVSAGYGMAM